MQDDHPAQPTPLSPEQWQAFRKKQRDDGYARQQAAKAARERAAKNGGAQPPPTDPWDRGVRASDVPLQPEHPEEQIAPNLAAALALAAAGILVFPALISEVWNEAKQEYDLKKKPAINGWQENASSDPHVIRGWWRIFLDAVPGIELGRSGMLVLDLDRHPGAPDGVEAFKKIPSAKLITPKPPMTKTGGNGFHVFFMQPEGKPFGNGEGNLPDGINVRGSGGWAVAPGAVFGEKVWRGVEVNPPLADAFKAKTIPVLPAWLASIIQPPKAETDSGPSSTGETSDKRGKAWAEGALRNIADRLASLSHTGRNNACFSAACKLGQMIARGWIGYETVRGRLTDAMHKNGYIKTDGAAKIADTIKRGIERGMETPHPNPRDNEKSRRYNFNEAGDIFEENAAESEGDKSTGRSWDDPDWTLIDDRRGDLPDLPLDVFTAPWQDLLLR